jgi:hypothetical protein
LLEILVVKSTIYYVDRKLNLLTESKHWDVGGRGLLFIVYGFWLLAFGFWLLGFGFLAFGLWLIAYSLRLTA